LRKLKLSQKKAV